MSQDMEKYPGLLPAFSHLLERLMGSVQFPAERQQSALLPLLPPSTTYYVAIPNYGEPAKQALTIFREELKDSSVLRDWWRQGDMAKNGPEVEHFIETFSRLSQYLGDEIVMSGQTAEHAPDLVTFAEARKPGLKAFLQQTLKDVPEKSRPKWRILDAEELPTARKEVKPSDLVILVRPDFVVASPTLEGARKFNAILDSKEKQFASTPFGQRISQIYEGGTSVAAAGDLHTIFGQMPKKHDSDQQMLEQSGLSDAKYLVWSHKSVDHKSISETELSFMGPRHGAAAWLAAPAKLGSLEFVSPKALFVMSVSLKNLGDVYDDIQQLASISNPKAFASVPQMEQALHLSLKDDLLRQLKGEITIELVTIVEKQPEWNLIFRVNDADRLQKAFEQLLATAPFQIQLSEVEGVRYHSFLMPSRPKPVQITYTFVDGYLLISSGRDVAAAAVALRKSGDSLAKSKALLATIPPGHSPEASAFFYEDAAAMMGLQAQQLSPELASTVTSRLSTQSIPITSWAYGEDTAMRGVSASGGADVTGILIGAAIAIPNLLRARIAANESSAVGTIRTINVAQVTYAATYRQKGFARSLATLGPNPRGPNAQSALHAGLIELPLGDPACTAGEWCTKTGYQFTVKALCREQGCKEYVVVGSPLSTSTGNRSFCSTSDAVVRVHAGPILTTPITAQECKKWPPLQ
jgi:hypothetical protein